MGESWKFTNWIVDKGIVSQESIDTINAVGEIAALASGMAGYVSIGKKVIDFFFGSSEPDYQEEFDKINKKIDQLSASHEKKKIDDLLNRFKEHKTQLLNHLAIIKTAQEQQNKMNYGNGSISEVKEIIAELKKSITIITGYDFNELPVLAASYQDSDLTSIFHYGIESGCYELFQSFDYIHYGDYFIHTEMEFTLQQCQASWENISMTLSLMKEPQWLNLQTESAPTANPAIKAASQSAADMPLFLGGVPNIEIARRWDGRFTLPLLLRAVALFISLTKGIEPLLRSTGSYREEVKTVVDSLGHFLSCWLNVILWTIDKPETAYMNQSQPYALKKYNCSVLDSVFGTIVHDNSYWHSVLNAWLPDGLVSDFYENKIKPEPWSESTIKEFHETRKKMLYEVLRNNGWQNLFNVTAKLDELRMPADKSECLKILTSKQDNDVISLATKKSTIISLDGPLFPEPHHFKGTLITRKYRRWKVVTVQKNPKPEFKNPKVLSSDCEFGYRITVQGINSSSEIVLFDSPLRTGLGEPGLYHNNDNSIYNLPRCIESPKSISFVTRTYTLAVENVRNGRTLKIDEKERPINIHYRITIEPENDKELDGIEYDTEFFGKIKIEIWSDNFDDFSSDMQINVYETIPNFIDNSNSKHTQYAITTTVSLLNRLVSLPSSYFDIREKAIKEFHDMIRDNFKPSQPVNMLSGIDDPINQLRDLLAVLQNPRSRKKLEAMFSRNLGRQVQQNDLEKIIIEQLKRLPQS